jgi:predicted RNA-binding protein with PUA-like domain
MIMATKKTDPKTTKKTSTKKTATKKVSASATKKTEAPKDATPTRESERRYWLVKSEPDVFSIDDLARDGRTSWEGVRNYQARNHMLTMQLGDLALYYHSNAEPSGVAGVCEIVRLAYPDPTQFDPKSDYHDPGSKPHDPRWKMVDVGFVERFPRTIALDALKQEKALEGMIVLQKGTRLSVTPVSREHFDHVCAMARR